VFLGTSPEDRDPVITLAKENGAMEPITFNLRPEPLRAFNKFFIPSAIVFGIASIILAFKEANHIRWITLLAGLVIIVQAIVNWHTQKPVTITWDDSGFRGSIAPGKLIAIQWGEVSAIDARMFALEIHLRNKTTVHVDLSQTTYQQHKEIKPLVLDLARTKGVDVRVA
jgi:hypothetical protein